MQGLCSLHCPRWVLQAVGLPSTTAIPLWSLPKGSWWRRPAGGEGPDRREKGRRYPSSLNKICVCVPRAGGAGRLVSPTHLQRLGAQAPSGLDQGLAVILGNAGSRGRCRQPLASLSSEAWPQGPCPPSESLSVGEVSSVVYRSLMFSCSKMLTDFIEPCYSLKVL